MFDGFWKSKKFLNQCFPMPGNCCTEWAGSRQKYWVYSINLIQGHFTSPEKLGILINMVTCNVIALLHTSVLMFYGKIFRLSDWIMEVYAAGLLLVMVGWLVAVMLRTIIWSLCCMFPWFEQKYHSLVGGWMYEVSFSVINQHIVCDLYIINLHWRVTHTLVGVGGLTSNGEKMKVKISLGALSNPIPLVKRSSEQFLFLL